MTRPYYPVSRFTRRQYRAEANMLRLIAGAVLLVLVALGLLASGHAQAQARGNDPIARFDGGIGALVAAHAGPTLILNDVNGVLPGGRPWVISSLKATATTTTIRVDGRGLLLAGGPGVGTTGNQNVHAVLFCGGQQYESATVALEPNGDFRIDSGYVGANGNAPDPCTNSRLLIVNDAGLWFAAGIPKL